MQKKCTRKKELEGLVATPNFMKNSLEMEEKKKDPET